MKRTMFGAAVLGVILAGFLSTPVWSQAVTRMFGTTTTGAAVPIAASTAGAMTVALNVPRITAGSGTGVTVNDIGSVRRSVYKVTVDRTQFIAAAVTADVTIATLPAKTRLVGVYADLTTQFACTVTCTSSTLSMTVGTAAGGAQILASFDADAAAAVFGITDGQLGTAMTAAARVQNAYLSWAGTIISARLTSGTGNVGTGAATNLSAGVVTFYLICEILP